MSAMQRRKGARIECEIVNAHKLAGVRAERYPLSGATRFRGSGHDIDIYAFGDDNAPAVAEVKSRKSGSGFALLERWLSDYDALFLRTNGTTEPMVVIPWRIWLRLIGGKAQPKARKTANGTLSDKASEGGLAP
jgi:hypothetical protein